MAFSNKNTPKKKANSNNECYNHHKFGHFRRNFSLPNRRLNKNTHQSQKKKSQRRDLQKKYHNREQNDLKTILN